MPTISINFNNKSGTFCPGDVVDGTVIIDCESKRKHMGITIKAEGVLNLHSSKDGSMDSLSSSSSKKILDLEIPLQYQEKLPEGKTEFPFQFSLDPIDGQTLYESYSGVYVSVNYLATVHIQGGLFAKSLEKSVEFFVFNPTPEVPVDQKPLSFTLSRDSLKKSSTDAINSLPDFSIVGQLDKGVCDICKPLSGFLRIDRCDTSIKSIEAQLLRVETVGTGVDRMRESTEIMNIQIAHDDPPKKVEIPLFLLFPKLFVCTSTEGEGFRIQFQLNLTVTLENNLYISDNLAFKIVRSGLTDHYA
ncbi:hypothetical protein P9112_000567 [Eukaryota sp. TZLM1-RC]